MSRKFSRQDFSKYPEYFFLLSALKHVSEKRKPASLQTRKVWKGFFVPNFNQFGSDNIHTKLQKGYQFDFEFPFSSHLPVTPNPN